MFHPIFKEDVQGREHLDSVHLQNQKYLVAESLEV